MFKGYKKTKLFLGLWGILIPFFLSACTWIGYPIIQTRNNQTNVFASYTDQTPLLGFKEYLQEALKSDEGQKQLSKYVSESLISQWFQTAAQTTNSSVYKNLYTQQQQKSQQQLRTLFSKYLQENQNNNQLASQKLQNNDLDPVGGNIQAYEQKELNSWAKTQFSTFLFANNYLTFKDNNQQLVALPTNTTLNELLTALKSDAFVFATNQTNLFDVEYAKFVNYLWNQYVEIENPYVINMVLWKYGIPQNGLQSLYQKAQNTSQAPANNNPNQANQTPTQQTVNNPGTYIYPYFADASVAKFKTFVSGVQKNDFYLQKGNLGLGNIPKELTDDSATLLLVKNSRAYDELYPEFAAAGSYLLYKNTDLLTNIDADIKQELTSNPNSVFDTISSHFIKTTPFSHHSKNIQLAPSYTSLVINPTGPLASVFNHKLYVSDAFWSEPFLFLRNQAGVHAVMIDGYLHLPHSNNNIKNLRQKAGQVVLFRALYNQIITKPNGYDFAIDIQKELQTFFDNNTTWLVWNYAQKKDQKLFNITQFLPNKNDQALVDAIVQEQFNNQYQNRPKAYNDKLLNAKKNYANNYGQNVSQNGLAAPWIYPLLKQNMFGLNTKLGFSLSATVQALGIKDSDLDAQINKIQPQISRLDDMQNSQLGGFDLQIAKQVQQHLYTTNFLYNQALVGFLPYQTLLVQIQYLYDYVRDVFDLKTGLFHNLQFNKIDYTNDVNMAFAHFFYGTNWQSELTIWSQFMLTNPQEDITAFKRMLWLQNNKIKNQTSYQNYLQLLQSVAWVYWNFTNNFTPFLTLLQNQANYQNNLYVIWQNQQNPLLTKQPKKTPQMLLQKPTDSMLYALNNDFVSFYFDPSQWSNPLQDNLSQTSLYGTNTTFFHQVGDMVGFLGLVNGQNSQLDAIVRDRLNNDPNQKGHLYNFISLAKLSQIPKSLVNQADVDAFARNLYQKTRIQTFNKIASGISSLKEKKEKLEKAIKDLENTNLIPTVFEKQNGLLSNQLLTSSNSLIQTAAYVLQLNQNDLVDLITFQKALLANKQQAIFSHLLVQQAIGYNQQEMVLTHLLATKKFFVYDLTTQKELYPKWVFRLTN